MVKKKPASLHHNTTDSNTETLRKEKKSESLSHKSGRGGTGRRARLRI